MKWLNKPESLGQINAKHLFHLGQVFSLGFLVAHEDFGVAVTELNVN